MTGEVDPGEIIDAAYAQRDHDAELREDIRRFREDFDLPVDDAIVQQFVTEYRAGRHEGGMWLTAAESTSSDGRYDAIEAGAGAIRTYVKDNAATFAGEWIAWRGGVPTLVVAFTRDIESHRAALASLHPHPELVEVVEHRYPLVELERLSQRAIELAKALATTGISWQGCATDVEANRVELEIVAPDEAEARRLLTAELGDAVVIEYLGPAEMTSEPLAWQMWTVDSSGCDLTVHYSTNATYSPDRVEHEEGDDAVWVTVFEQIPVGATPLPGAVREATVRLAGPLGDRAVIDGSSGETRPERGTHAFERHPRR